MANPQTSREVSLEPIHIKLLRSRHTRYIGHLFFSLIVLLLLTGIFGEVVARIIHIQDVKESKLKALTYRPNVLIYNK